ncbi:MAG TPA: zeta toxin family protein [Longimicrobium sp.]|nr:zeta toxin family protein [Longimicrobium sp.]
MEVPRLRMFAGPNGSGKSTIKSVIAPDLLGVYINADEVEQQIRERNTLDLRPFGVRASQEEISAFFGASTLLRRAGLTSPARSIQLRDESLHFGDVAANSYYASVVADFLRRKLLDAGASLTFETVMSSPDKVEFLGSAQARGFRTYLYYIATGNPLVNVSRVRNRVRDGGHPVPEEKIISRYSRSLELLAAAIRVSHRAYIFDNSTRDKIWLAEVTDGRKLEMRTDQMPAWFKHYVWDRME